MATSDVRDTSPGAQLLLYAVKRRYPFFAYVGFITGAKKPLRPAKKAIVMISPKETRSGPETLGDERLIVIDCRDGVEPSRHRRRTVRISEHRGLFGENSRNGNQCTFSAQMTAQGARESLQQ